MPHYLDYLGHSAGDAALHASSLHKRMEAETFPAGQSFDTVMCLNVVEHVQDDVGALRNIRECP